MEMKPHTIFTKGGEQITINAHHVTTGKDIDGDGTWIELFDEKSNKVAQFLGYTGYYVYQE